MDTQLAAAIKDVVGSASASELFFHALPNAAS